MPSKEKQQLRHDFGARPMVLFAALIEPLLEH
jgi:hypothetical protein